jgi:subtilisin family serine protease
MFRRGAPAAIVAVLLMLSQVMTAAASPGARAPGGAAATRGVAAPIQKGLEKKIAAGEAKTILVEFAGKADLAPARKIKDRTKRGQAVLSALTATANTAQSAAVKVVAKTKGARATSYWLTNVLVVQSSDAKVLDKLARQLAAVPGVTSVRAPKTYPLVTPVETKVAILAAAGDPEWGVAKIRADEAWADGILGQGIVVSSVDTGVDYLHPALVDHYRGNLGGGAFDHAYNWWDPTGICGPEPCDNAAHGTHTMGTMVGGDGPGPFSPDTGVAPGAQWIAAKAARNRSVRRPPLSPPDSSSSRQPTSTA